MTTIAHPLTLPPPRSAGSQNISVAFARLSIELLLCSTKLEEVIASISSRLSPTSAPRGAALSPTANRR